MVWRSRSLKSFPLQAGHLSRPALQAEYLRARDQMVLCFSLDMEASKQRALGAGAPIPSSSYQAEWTEPSFILLFYLDPQRS